MRTIQKRKTLGLYASATLTSDFQIILTPHSLSVQSHQKLGGARCVNATSAFCCCRLRWTTPHYTTPHYSLLK